ncbi:endonuclease/exonuclease/phosphatase family protein [bacterium AH-315-P07]|nr:endonuclease/exonuclease/phosphatase family protein [bacterium AH-315-P07]
MKYFFVSTTLFAFGLITVHDASAQDEGEFPFAPTPGHLRLVTWNIELLGKRTPIRTEEQLLAIAARIATFDAAIVAIQEITYENGQVLPRSRPALETLVSALGWQTAIGDWNNGFLYDPTKVELLERVTLEQLRYPPYSTFYDDFPNWQSEFGPNGAPFGHESSLPELAIFRAIDGKSQPFCLISTHFTFGSSNEFIRAYAGAALKQYIDERYADLTFTPSIYLVGDFNARPDTGSPHDELTANTPLNYIAKEYTSATTAVGFGAELDHVYTTNDAYLSISAALAFVIRPSHYGESNAEFEATFSDHTPVFIDTLPLPLVSPIYVDHAATMPGLGTTEAPLKGIDEAIAAADNGFTIILAPGSYNTIESPLIISKPLTLVSANPGVGTVSIGVSE